MAGIVFAKFMMPMSRGETIMFSKVGALLLPPCSLKLESSRMPWLRCAMVHSTCWSGWLIFAWSTSLSVTSMGTSSWRLANGQSVFLICWVQVVTDEGEEIPNHLSNVDFGRYKLSPQRDRLKNMSLHIWLLAQKQLQLSGRLLDGRTRTFRLHPGSVLDWKVKQDSWVQNHPTIQILGPLFGDRDLLWGPLTGQSVFWWGVGFNLYSSSHFGRLLWLTKLIGGLHSTQWRPRTFRPGNLRC